MYVVWEFPRGLLVAAAGSQLRWESCEGRSKARPRRQWGDREKQGMQASAYPQFFPSEFYFVLSFAFVTTSYFAKRVSRGRALAGPPVLYQPAQPNLNLRAGRRDNKGKES